MFTIEYRTEEGWGQFSETRHRTEAEALNMASTVLKNTSYVAARVWKAGKNSLVGDRVIWDSRD